MNFLPFIFALLLSIQIILLDSYIAPDALAADCIDGNQITITDQDGAKTVIVISDNATAQVKTAAAELSKYIKLSANVDVELKSLSELKHPRVNLRIIVTTIDSLRNGADNSFKNADEFAITFPDKKTIAINGATDWGAAFGIYEFIERYIGVRWLMPGPDGTYIPHCRKISVPMQALRGKPAFESRLMSGFKGPEQFLWARHHQMHGLINFHHNLFNLFPPAVYAKTRPEIYPVISGKRFLPKDNNEHAWQPCFLAPGLADLAIKNICDYFERNPEAISYSLGVNDSSGHCECNLCRIRTGGQKNFLGYRHVSDLYFEWANAVAEGVLKNYPDKWFGCLAYSEVAAPPFKVKIHPRIIPFMTYDRMKWVDHSFESEGRKLTEDWSGQAAVLGWYDYIYGTPYIVPRVYFHKMAEYYRYGYEHGVRAMYAEAYPNWGEGPKLYIALKLQWNPYLNVDELLNDWYEKCVGQKAAPYLKSYYALWEDFWTKKAPHSKWFFSGNQYLWFHEAGYIDLIDKEISRSRALLQIVVSKTTSAAEKKRANLIFKAFEYYEASVLSYQNKGRCFGLKSLLLGNDCDLYKKMNEKRFILVKEFENDPILIHPSRFDKLGILQW